jgi:hypothetical protein
MQSAHPHSIAAVATPYNYTQTTLETDTQLHHWAQLLSSRVSQNYMTATGHFAGYGSRAV